MVDIFDTHCQHSHSDPRKALPSLRHSPKENLSFLWGIESMAWLCPCEKDAFALHAAYKAGSFKISLTTTKPVAGLLASKLPHVDILVS